MTKLVALALLLGFTGCLSGSSNDLASTPVAVDVTPAAGQLAVRVAGLNEIVNGVASTAHCLTLSDATTITANGIAGTLVAVGGLPFDADSCDDARFTVALSSLPDVIDIAIDDGTARLAVQLVRSGAVYGVAHCDAATCTVAN
jgi:hypothetical protein